MKKVSTLIYFLTNFQSDADSVKIDSGDQLLENSLSAMKTDAQSPSDRTINNILNFARSYEVIETEKTGYVEMNLN